MIIRLICIILIYFAIGFAAIFVISKKEAGTSKEKWKKYFVYLIIVNLIVFSIVSGRFVFIAVGLLIVGLYEVISVYSKLIIKSNTKLLSAIIIYLLIGFAFFRFSSMENINGQLFTYALVFTFDGFSQIVGQLTGRTKPFSSISPNKTLEGAAGGFIIALLTSLLLGQYLMLTIAETLMLSSSIAITAFAGDLAASYYKRQCKVKDYSNLIPGHGGVLDRFDSFIAAGAFYWFITQLNLL